MSTRTQQQADASSGLSVSTLVIASLSSIAAALVIHKFWTGGAILGAGLTPVIVAIVSESLKKPQRAIVARRQARTAQGPSATRVEPPQEDRFGIWDDERRSDFSWVRGRALKVAIATGVAAFLLGAFLLTGAELVFGGGGGGGGDRLTVVPGRQSDRDADRESTRTAPSEETQEAPEEQLTQPPPEEVPTTPGTTPQAPPGAVPPAETQPAPETPVPPQTVPAEPAPPQ